MRKSSEKAAFERSIMKYHTYPYPLFIFWISTWSLLMYRKREGGSVCLL